MKLVYVDTSVLMAQLRAEDRSPSEVFWDAPLISSRLIEYETFARLNSEGKAALHGEAARNLLSRLSIIELVEPVVGRVLDPFPLPLRTLDALHVASMLFLVEQGVKLRLASYDRRLNAAADALGIPLYPL